MKTTGTPISHGTVPADYVPRKGDVLKHDSKFNTRGIVIRAVEGKNLSYDWMGGTYMTTVKRFVSWAIKSGATLTRAPE